MSTEFFERPILNSPYEEPQRHWALNSDGQPTQYVACTRARDELLITAVSPESEFLVDLTRKR